MGRVLWPLALVVTFGLGLAVASMVRKDSPAVQEAAQLRDTVGRLQQQVDTLQARLRARETLAAQRASGADQQFDGPQGSRTRSRSMDRLAAASLREERMLSERVARGGSAAPAQGGRPGEAAAAQSTASGPAPTVEVALERFYRYLEAMNGGEGRERWQRVRELVNEMRAMGDTGAQALMQVLASGSDSDERRAAARLLGTLQAAQALPLLRDIVEKEDDLLLRRAAAFGLRRLQTPESVPVMERMLANAGEDRFVRLSAASGLANFGRPAGVTGLAQIFEESNADGRGRELAFRALSALNDERPLPFMRQVVTSHAEPSYRLQAIKYLTAQGDRQALGTLQMIMQSSNEQPSIRDAAAQAHAILSGK